MTGALFATANLAVLIIPPALILFMPARHLAYLVPAGATAYMLLWRYVETEDLGPAGIIIVAYLALLFIVNIGALSTRAIVEGIWAVRTRDSARKSD